MAECKEGLAFVSDVIWGLEGRAAYVGWVDWAVGGPGWSAIKAKLCLCGLLHAVLGVDISCGKM